MVSLAQPFIGKIHNCRSLVNYQRKTTGSNELENNSTGAEFDSVDTNHQIIERTKKNCAMSILNNTAMGEVIKCYINGDTKAINDVIKWVYFSC